MYIVYINLKTLFIIREKRDTTKKSIHLETVPAYLF